MVAKTFSIENKINPLTNTIFGQKYSGNFNIRRPSLLDHTMIESRIAAERNAFGLVQASQVPEGQRMAARICHTVAQLSEEVSPKWFDRSEIFDDEGEFALAAVWGEVNDYIDSFRPKTDNATGGEAGQQS